MVKLQPKRAVKQRKWNGNDERTIYFHALCFLDWMPRIMRDALGLKYADRETPVFHVDHAGEFQRSARRYSVGRVREIDGLLGHPRAFFRGSNFDGEQNQPSMMR